MLMRDEIDGLVIIPEEYGSLKEGDKSRENALTCDFIPGSRSFAADMVREHFMLASLVVSIKNALVDDLLSREEAIQSTTDYQTMMRRLDQATMEELSAGRDVRVEIHKLSKSSVHETGTGSDLAIDAMFLHLRAAGRMMTTSRATVRMAEFWRLPTTTSHRSSPVNRRLIELFTGRITDTDAGGETTAGLFPS